MNIKCQSLWISIHLMMRIKGEISLQTGNKVHRNGSLKWIQLALDRVQWQSLV
jgi:hypothetical protein